jgi:hypothetical protein
MYAVSEEAHRIFPVEVYDYCWAILKKSSHDCFQGNYHDIRYRNKCNKNNDHIFQIINIKA